MNIWEKLTDTYDNKTETIREFSKRYENTYLAYHFENKIEYLNYKYFSTENNTFVFETSYLNTIELDFDNLLKDYTIKIPKIEKGFYYTNYKMKPNFICYISRYPKRQWLRGVHEYNYKFMNFSSILKLEPTGISQTNKIILAALKQQNNKHQITNQIFKFCDQDKEYIINNNFLLTLNVKEPEGYSLFFHKFLIGTFKTESLFVVENSLFLQEFLEEKETWDLNFKMNL